MTPRKRRPAAPLQSNVGTANAFEGVQRWLHTPWFVPLFVFLAALAWRAAYLARLHDTPYFSSHAADAGVYWNWSESILRSGLTPPGPFFLAPLYPFVLALERAVSGGSTGGVLFIQALIGSAGAALLASAAAALTRPAIGLTVGLVVSLYRTAVFFDGLLLPESLLFTLESLLIWLVARSAWSSSTRAYVVYGLIVGVIAQGRGVAMPLLLVLPLLAIGSGVPLRGVIRNCFLALAAFGLLALPATLANYSVTREIIPFTYSAGLNLYIGNHPLATGTYVDVLAEAEQQVIPPASALTGGELDGRAYLSRLQGRPVGPSESSRIWARMAGDHVRSQPAHAFRITARKLGLLLSHREIPQIENVESFEIAAGPLGLPWLGEFGVVGVLGLAGMVLALRRGPRERWMAGSVVVLMLATLPFFVTDRYRHHLVPGLVVLAAIGLDGLVQTIRENRSGELPRRAAWIAAAAVIVWLPIPGTQTTHQWGLSVDRGMRLLQTGAVREAIAEFGRAEKSLEKTNVARMSPTARREAAEFYIAYSGALESAGDVTRAIEMLEKSTALNPADVQSAARLYDLLVRAGLDERAKTVRARVEPLPDGQAEMIASDGYRAASQGDLQEARTLFRGALARNGRLSRAWEGLLRVEIQAGNPEGAAEVLSQARSNGLEETTANVYEAFLRMMRGDARGARQLAQRVDAKQILDPNLKMLLDMTLQRTSATMP